MSERLKSLTDILNVLSSSATAQLEYLRKINLPDSVDELALEFDDIAAAADDMFRLGELDKNQCDSLKKLSEILSQMSGEANARLWTSDALSSAPEWGEVRALAKESLRSIVLLRRVRS